jgi:hypothetical protein
LVGVTVGAELGVAVFVLTGAVVGVAVTTTVWKMIIGVGEGAGDASVRGEAATLTSGSDPQARTKSNAKRANTNESALVLVT